MLGSISPARVDAAIDREPPIEGIDDDGWSAAVVVLGQDLAP